MSDRLQAAPRSPSQSLPGAELSPAEGTRQAAPWPRSPEQRWCPQPRQGTVTSREGTKGGRLPARSHDSSGQKNTV